MSESKEQQHTPTPWRFQRKNFIVGDEHDDMATIVAEVDFGDTKKEAQIGEANARFIVRAVNSHEALVTACRNGLQSRIVLLGECGHEPPVDSCTTCGFRSALALAEKES